MKKFALGMIFFGFLFILSGSSLLENFKYGNYQKGEIVFDKVLPAVDLSNEYDIEGNFLKSYSYKNDLGISYVNIEEFIEFLNGGIIDLDTEKTDTLSISYSILIDENFSDSVGSNTYTYEMVFDANTNKISFNDFDFLANLNVVMESNYLTDVTMVGLDAPDQSYAHEIDLNNYNFDIVLYDNNYYIPLFLANLFFSGSYMNVYELGNEIYLIDNFTDLSNLVNHFNTDNTYNLDSIMDQTSHYLALYFDNFYGLKDFKGVDTYIDVVSKFNLDNQYSVNGFYKQIDNFLMRRDDLHTSLVMAGYRDADYINSTNYLKGEKINSFMDTYIDYACYKRSEEITYAIYNDTMVISLNSFTLNTKDLIAPIMEKSKDYDNVIFDLSCNSGGLVISVIEVLVYLTDQPIPLSYMNPVTDTENTEYYQSTISKYINNNYYLRTSSVTFSAANLFTSIFKDMKLGPVMGSKTSGGAAAITYTVLPDGAIIVNSSDMVFINENKEVIEDGIDVDLSSDYSYGWWENINRFSNIVEFNPNFKFNYDNITEFLNFNIEINIDDLDVEKFTLSFNDYDTGELVKEYVFTDLLLSDSFEKPENLDDYTVTLRAQYTYKTVYSDEMITLDIIDKDLGIVGPNNYTEVTVDKSFSINTLNHYDVDVVKINLTQSGLYAIQSVSETRSIKIYDESYNYLGSFKEFQLSEGIYYVAIVNAIGDHDYILKALVDDNKGHTLINLVNGDNLNHAFLDYYDDVEGFEFTLDQDKIINLSFNKDIDYQIYANGHKFDLNIDEYNGLKDYTILFTKGSYTINVYNGRGLINFNANVLDASSDLYTNDFSKDKEFGKLSIGENEIIFDYKGDKDIYFVDITEKGNYVFEGDYVFISRIDENGKFNNLSTKTVIELDTGRYYFAFNYDNLQKKILKIEFNLVIDDSDENNHVVITIGDQITTKVNNALDKDYFDFTISESGLYRINFSSDYVAVRFDVFNENNELVTGFKNYTQDITLSEGNYTIVLYQPTINGGTLKNATFSINKK